MFRLDRLTRSGIRDTFELIEELRTAGVEVISIADGFSLDGPAAEVILAVMSWAAKMERLAINERIPPPGSASRPRARAGVGRHVWTLHLLKKPGSCGFKVEASEKSRSR